MLGGAHVWRRSVSLIIEALPCVRIEKRKYSGFQRGRYESPNKARLVVKPPIASTSPFQPSRERVIRARRGLLEWQSLEDGCGCGGYVWSM